MPLFFSDCRFFYGSFHFFYDVISIVSQTLNKIFLRFSLASCICSFLGGQFATDSVFRSWVWSKRLVTLGCSFPQYKLISIDNWYHFLGSCWGYLPTSLARSALQMWWQMVADVLCSNGRGNRTAGWWHFSNKQVGKLPCLGYLRRSHTYSKLPFLN